MKIVADENIPYLSEFFGEFGELKTAPGRSLTQSDIRDADILLVRSVTPVNENLLKDTKVKFVGTCTIGVDHLDADYMNKKGIAYASAPGCNAGGVLQYDFNILAHLRPEWPNLKIGVVGCGNVGGRINKAMLDIGIDCVVYDPFLKSQQVPNLCDLSELLNRCDVICMHTPYTNSGPHPTHHMINTEQLNRMKPGVLLINAGRGGAINNAALLDFLKAGKSIDVCLDVWESEPNIHLSLLDYVDIATPHIAGYSFEGKLNGTAMIYEALAVFLGMDPAVVIEHSAKRKKQIMDVLETIQVHDVNSAIKQSYSVLEDDRRTRLALTDAVNQNNNAGLAFDQLRKTYPIRREFGHFRVNGSELDEQSKRRLKALGFACD